MNNAPKTTQKTTIIIIAIVVSALIGYFYYKGSAPSSDSLLVGQAPTSIDVGANVVVLLNQVKDLHIKTDLFSDPAFLSLKDYTVAVPPLPVGRPNPFQPIPGFNPNPPAAKSSR